MSHTKEPWIASQEENEAEWGIDSGKWGIAICAASPGNGTAESNARRIVACVNACKGSPTEALEEMNRLGLTLGQLAFNHAEIMATVKDLPSGDEIRDVGVHLEAVTKQRDELLIALECLFARTFMTENSHTAQVFERARAAIISVKGGAA